MIRLTDCSASAHCRGELFTCKDAFPALTHQFERGKVYALCGDIGCGGWGLAWTLGGRGENIRGQILLGDAPASNEALAKRVCFIGEKTFAGINSRLFPRTVGECLTRALRMGSTQMTTDELAQAFHLSSERFERSMAHIYPAYSWFVSAAVGFAAGKDVFAFPYLNPSSFGTLERMNELCILPLLKNAGKIILVPTNQRERILPLCDESLDMETCFRK